MWPALLIVVCLAVAGGALLRGLRPPFRPPPYSVAVLAFANLTGDPGQDYLADGLADDLIGRLGGVPAVHVVARASSFAFKGSHATAAGMARALGVGAVLEGSLSQTGGMRTIRVQLVDGQNGYVVWNRQFAAPVADAAILQAGIAEGLLQALHVPGAQADAAQAGLGTTRNEAALDAFLRGLHDYAGADAAGAERAVADFDQALSHDPGFALALVRRAAAIVLVVDNESSGDAAWLNRMSAQAMASVERAIAIAPGLGVAHSQLASMKLELNRDFAGALTEAEQARTLAPGDARVQIDVAYVLGALGRQAEAEAAARSAVAHDPLSAASWRQLALTLLYGRKFADAAASLAHARAVEPAETDYDRLLLSQIVLKLGHPEQALQLAGKMQGWTGTFIRALALHALGREGEAAQQFSALQTTLRDFGALRYADILAQSGRTAEALSWLRKAAAANDPNLFLIREDYLLDPLRDTQDFQAIERGLKFPD